MHLIFGPQGFESKQILKQALARDHLLLTIFYSQDWHLIYLDLYPCDLDVEGLEGMATLWKNVHPPPLRRSRHTITPQGTGTHNLSSKFPEMKFYRHTE